MEAAFKADSEENPDKDEEEEEGEGEGEGGRGAEGSKADDEPDDDGGGDDPNNNGDEEGDEDDAEGQDGPSEERADLLFGASSWERRHASWEEQDNDDDEEEEEEEDGDDEDDEDGEGAGMGDDEEAEHAERNEHEDEDEEDREGDMAELAALDELHKQNLEESNSGGADDNRHITELRRQAMIESLIGMGFPVEWALRAAEHCDVTTSESAAISWIIERMEMEQNKLDDAEQEGDSNRTGDEEEHNESEDSTGIDYFIQRHAATLQGLRRGASGSSSSSSSSAESDQTGAAEGAGAGAGADRRSTRTAAEAESDPDASFLDQVNAMGGAGSPTREEIYGIRRGLLSMGLNLLGNSDESTSSGGATQSGARAAKGGSKSSQHASKRDRADDRKDAPRVDTSEYQAWNGDVEYGPVLLGHYTAKRRHDLDKQEVLVQVSELNLSDILSIIASCEFTLCIYYARATLLRVLRDLERYTMPARSPSPYPLFRRPSLTTQHRPVTHRLGVESAGTLGVGEEADAKQTLSTREESGLGLGSVVWAGPGEEADGKGQSRFMYTLVYTVPPAMLSRCLKSCFKQCLVHGSSQPERLLPLMCNGNATGDIRDQVPPIAPFITDKQLQLHALLGNLEATLFIQSYSNLAVEEPSVQTMRGLSAFIEHLVDLALTAEPPANNSSSSIGISSAAGSPTHSIANSPLRDVTGKRGGAGVNWLSSDFSDLQDHALKAMGVDMHPPYAAQDKDKEDKEREKDKKRDMDREGMSANMDNDVKLFPDAQQCSEVVVYLVEDALRILEQAGSEDPQTDWIWSGLTRDDSLYKHAADDGNSSSTEQAHDGGVGGSPLVLWAYWLLRKVLVKKNAVESAAAHNCLNVLEVFSLGRTLSISPVSAC